MTTFIRKILCAALLGTGVVVATPASADVELMFGIYAADNRVKMMWQCGSLVAAV